MSASEWACDFRRLQLLAQLHILFTFARCNSWCQLQMIRELPMDRDSRTLSSQTSSVPIWLQDNKLSATQPSSSLKRHPKAAQLASARSPKSPRHALHAPKHNTKPHQNSSMQKPKGNKYMGFIAPRTKPGNSSYHDLSLEVRLAYIPA